MAGAIPTNSARMQGKSVASLAVASDGGRDCLRRPGAVRRLFFFRPYPSTAAEGQGVLSRRVGRTLLKSRGLHPTPANISIWRQTGATDAFS
jgi:hypothetical protein